MKKIIIFIFLFWPSVCLAAGSSGSGADSQTQDNLYKQAEKLVLRAK